VSTPRLARALLAPLLAALVAAPASAQTGLPFNEQAGIRCDPGTWSGGPAFAYTWLRDTATVTGETGGTYQPTDLDVGHSVRCHVKATNATGSAEADSSNARSVPNLSAWPPGNVQRPGIAPATVAARDGIGCGVGSWFRATGYAYEWLRDGAPIPGQTASSYSTTPDDAGRAIACRVTATGPGGATSASSDAVTVGPAGPLLTQSFSTDGGTTVIDGGLVVQDVTVEPRAQVVAALRAARFARIHTLLRRGGASLLFLAPGRGRLRIEWAQLRKDGGRVLARGSRRLKGSGPTRLRARLTKTGRRVLRMANGVTMVVTLDFAPDDGIERIRRRVVFLTR
jgi:hypothetical protein